ncbi:Translocation protein SEC62 [Echinococcus granulosus]|uniref:Translocation protein SEC62 n=1 Tax=Echinococcus granulosus TaxID=6210 RepID=W6UL94_ECHGR|nr:Translocation protein SEC62 [Echinococcus granulosus]EUB54284.1 Translocation protein SEC62 [Echinococcus granulosus]
MNSKKRGKVKRCDTSGGESQPSPFELEVCKYLYRNLPSSEGRLGGCCVNYFYASNAVECLLQSKWADPLAKVKHPGSVQFSNSDVVVRFMGKLLEKKLIGSIGTSTSPKKSLGTTRSIGTKNSKSSVAKEISFMSYFVSSSSSCVAGKRKKPARLEYTVDQVFVLDDEGEDEVVYVWIYEAPPSLITWLLGLAMIAGVIACCAFPMWPWQARQGAYYATLVAFTLLGFLLFLATLRALMYTLLLLLSLGRLRLWLFPNLFADCGFFESFQPLYTLDRVTVPTPNFVTDNTGEKE